MEDDLDLDLNSFWVQFFISYTGFFASGRKDGSDILLIFFETTEVIEDGFASLDEDP